MLLKSYSHSSIWDVTFSVNINILCFQGWNYLFVEILLSYDFITIDDILKGLLTDLE